MGEFGYSGLPGAGGSGGAGGIGASAISASGTALLRIFGGQFTSGSSGQGGAKGIGGGRSNFFENTQNLQPGSIPQPCALLDTSVGRGGVKGEGPGGSNGADGSGTQYCDPYENIDFATDGASGENAPAQPTFLVSGFGARIILFGNSLLGGLTLTNSQVSGFLYDGTYISASYAANDGGIFTIENVANPESVPEPSTAILLALGLFAFRLLKQR
jgi:hypothetical protein